MLQDFLSLIINSVEAQIKLDVKSPFTSYNRNAHLRFPPSFVTCLDAPRLPLATSRGTEQEVREH